MWRMHAVATPRVFFRLSYPALTRDSTCRQQKLYANKIKPIRKNGPLLLVTLLLANMIVNESLPVISDPVLGGGVQSVVVSTVLIVMCVFSTPFLSLHTLRERNPRHDADSAHI